jgi:hypothetical protein
MLYFINSSRVLLTHYFHIQNKSKYIISFLSNSLLSVLFENIGFVMKLDIILSPKKTLHKSFMFTENEDK